MYALYTIDDDDHGDGDGNNDNNLNDVDEKKVHGFAFISNEAVSMLPHKSEKERRKERMNEKRDFFLCASQKPKSRYI